MARLDKNIRRCVLIGVRATGLTGPDAQRLAHSGAKVAMFDALGRPEDIAAACAFLVSDEASYITGQVIGVNGRNT